MNIIRSFVSGERNRLQNSEYNLDLTYVTPRVIAMSYPASTLKEKVYRNNIDTVAEYLQKTHKNKYKVFNLTGRDYDTTPFLNQVHTYQWEDHHSPTLVLLF
jgi:phosphatidylinositol-3,4,5-trisphosphate 3-phosphatase/dual-specificity protein phosphatase PTEN